LTGNVLPRPQNATRRTDGITFDSSQSRDRWSFFTEPDPSNGLVRYRDRDTAFAKGLAFWTQDGTPGIQVSLDLSEFKHFELKAKMCCTSGGWVDHP
jgi:hypothetical protein